MIQSQISIDKAQTNIIASKPNTSPKRENFWTYACVFGSLWGALELTLGTFLHTLHVPKTGLIMVSLSLILLLAQRSIYPLRGSTLAAGIIAACIKSLSPGGIVLGPMLGILSEAAIVELCLLAQPRALFSSVLAGSLAVLWSQIYSVFKLWLYYGRDFIDIFIRLIEKFFRVEWSIVLGWSVVATFLLLVMSIGGLSGWIGWRWGRRVSKEIHKKENLSKAQSILVKTHLLDKQPSHTVTPNTVIPLRPLLIRQPQTTHKTQAPRRSLKACEPAIRTRRYVFPVALATLIMQFGGELWLSLAAIVIFLGLLFFVARPIILTLWWPRFWAFSLLISLFGGLILAWQIEGHFDFILGAEASARMLTRGLYVFTLITWATRCVRSDEILKVWDKLGMPELGVAIKNAYLLLPAWLDQFNAMLNHRPKGFRAKFAYLKNCAIDCLLEASRQARIS